MVAEDISPGGAADAMLPERITVLLVEDDDGDALLVEELLLDAGVPFVLRRARSLADARSSLAEAACVLPAARRGRLPAEPRPTTRSRPPLIGMASVVQAGPCHADHPSADGNGSHSGDRGCRPYRRIFSLRPASQPG